MEERTYLQDFPEILDSFTSNPPLPAFISDLARLEWALHQIDAEPAAPLPSVAAVAVNPTLKLVPVGWKHLPGLLSADPTS